MNEDDDSDIEFYSFIQVNDDLTNGEESHPNLPSQKEIPVRMQNSQEDQFFKKLSFAFYSDGKSNSQSTNILNTNNENIKPIPSSKIMLLENQNTQPHTPKYIISTKQDEVTDVKNPHHLMKNYQIKKIQKYPFPIETQMQDEQRKKSARSTASKIEEETTLYQTMEIVKKVNENNQNNQNTNNRLQNNNMGQQKKVLMKKNENKMIDEQLSYDQPDRQQTELSTTSAKKYNQTTTGFFLQEQLNPNNARIQQEKPSYLIQQDSNVIGKDSYLNQQDSNINGKDQNQNEKVSQLNGKDSYPNRSQINKMLKYNADCENIDSILLNDSYVAQQDQHKIKNKKSRCQPGETKYDFINHFTTNRSNGIQSESKKKLFTLDNNFNLRTEEAENIQQQKPQISARNRILQASKDQTTYNQQSGVNIQNRNQERENILQQSNNYFKNNQANIVQDKISNEDNKLLFSVRKKRLENNQIPSSNHTPTQNLTPQSNYTDNSLFSSVKTSVSSKFNNKLRKNGTLQQQDKEYSTPRSSLAGVQQTVDKSSVNNSNNNNIHLTSAPQSSREEYVSFGSKSELIPSKKYSILQKANFHLNSSSSKKYNKIQIQGINSIDQSTGGAKQNKTSKEQQLILQSAVSPNNNLKASNNLLFSNLEENNNLEHKNSFLQQVFKSKMQVGESKYLLKNNLIRMPNTTSSQKCIPFFSSQNSNNHSQKNIQSPKVISSTTLSSSKQKFYIHPKKKVESIYINEFEDDQGFSAKIAKQY